VTIHYHFQLILTLLSVAEEASWVAEKVWMQWWRKCLSLPIINPQ